MVDVKVKDFFEKYSRVEYEKHGVIIFANEKLDHVFYLESGVVNMYDISEKGNRSILNTFKPGAFFPMSNIINNVEPKYFFEADEKVTLRKASALDVIEFLKKNNDVMYDLLSRVYRGTDGLVSKIAELMQGDIGSRVLNELRICAARFGSEENEFGYVLNQKITEAGLSERTGLARETVSRSIKKLIEEKKIDKYMGKYRILE
jgi:CRP-like cAMP-binding protein